MRVTAIQKQVKNTDRYSVYIDGEYSFSLSSSALLGSGLAVNDELSSAHVSQLKEKSAQDKLYSAVLALIARRMRSKWEIEQYLKRKQVDEDRSKDILNTLSDQKYIDDRVFAEAWVRNRRLLKMVSFRKLRLELLAKHVSNEIIEEVLRSDETNETYVLVELVRKKRSQSRYQDDQKLMQYLTRQGFSYSDVKDALRQVGED